MFSSAVCNVPEGIETGVQYAELAFWLYIRVSWRCTVGVVFGGDGGGGALVGVHRIQKLESLHPVLLQLTKHYLQVVERGTLATSWRLPWL